MRKLVLGLIAVATLGTMSVAANAMPLAGATSVAQPATMNSAIQKTEVVVVKKRRPAVVVHRRAPVVVKKVRRPAIVIH